MKHIRKGPEPAEIIAWKSTDKKFQRGDPLWDRLPTLLKHLLREQLKQEQGFICCYCERRLENADYHNEHLRPQGIPAYAPYQLDYDNLLCSCQFELEKGAPRHCGNSKGSWYDQQLLISPLDPACETKFNYTADGQIIPADAGDNAAVTTIFRLQLGIDKLNAMRKAAIEPFLDNDLTPEQLEAFVQGYLVDKEQNNGQYNQFYTTIKHLFPLT